MSGEGRIQLGKPLERRFYLEAADVVAPKLLGHYLVTEQRGNLCAGMIVEVEAYLTGDAASHSFRGKTPRNEVMWGEPGRAYVYFIYGNHFCVNAVCQPAGIAEAVLIRAVEPVLGEALMQKRRAPISGVGVSNGPGKLCAAMGIKREYDSADLCDESSPLQIVENEDRKATLKEFGPIIETTRIGITKAADLPLRFYLDKNPYVSRKAKL